MYPKSAIWLFEWITETKFVPPHKRISRSEQCCIDIFNDYSASEIVKESASIRFAWEEGKSVLERVNNEAS